MIPDPTTSKIMFFKNKIKNHETIKDIDWIEFKNYFIYDHKFSNKKLLKSQINQLTNCKTKKSRSNCS